MKLIEITSEINVWNNWVNAYKKYVPKFIKEATTKTTWQEWDVDVFKEYFEKSNDQCVSSLKQGYFTKEEQRKIKENWSQVAPLLKDVASNQENPQWKKYEELKRVVRSFTQKDRRSATNRLIAGLQPKLLSTIVKEESLRELYDYLQKNIEETLPSYQHNWFKDSYTIAQLFQQSNPSESFMDLISYPWQVYEYSKNPNSTTEIMKEDRTHKYTILPDAINQILYGPPGTGKTYATKELAVDKIFGVDKNRNREEVIKLYKKLVDNQQVVFTTFHQSMSYEDFVEGIKPKTQGNDVIYDVEDGIFKLLSDTAKDNWEAYHNNISDKKVAFDDVFNQLKEDWEENNEIQFPMKREGNDFTIIGFTNRSIQFKKASGGTGHTLSIDTLKKGFYNEKSIRSTGVGIYYPSIIDRLKTYKASKEESTELKSHVLIIDEINRGNLSAIFGELITLLEPDKRLGQKEEITVTLPYSKSESKFGIPSNLHIIGTMNTADRSVEALDTALRRRFEFKEMMPDPSLLKHIKFDDFNLETVLTMINNRIELLLDRDHTIGHSYFFDTTTKEQLETVFNNKVIPLLQEYFYNDYEKIGLVLGEGFVQKIKNDKKVTFPNFIESDNFIPEVKYRLKIKDTEFDIIEALKTLTTGN
ncbi:McrB family protein [Tenacibaculum halocynthiae]|uniref:McrB family protein n=1 Tax=Tenacibaculum halocynthiae TaxID=1254437 RepID=UPI003D654F8C